MERYYFLNKQECLITFLQTAENKQNNNLKILFSYNIKQNKGNVVLKEQLTKRQLNEAKYYLENDKLNQLIPGIQAMEILKRFNLKIHIPPVQKSLGFENLKLNF